MHSTSDSNISKWRKYFISYFFKEIIRVTLKRKKKKIKNFKNSFRSNMARNPYYVTVDYLSVTSVWRAIVHPFSLKLWLNVAKTCSLPHGRYFSSPLHLTRWLLRCLELFRDVNFLELTISHRSFCRNDFRVSSLQLGIGKTRWRWRWRWSQ